MALWLLLLLSGMSKIERMEPQVHGRSRCDNRTHDVCALTLDMLFGGVGVLSSAVCSRSEVGGSEEVGAKAWKGGRGRAGSMQGRSCSI